MRGYSSFLSITVSHRSFFKGLSRSFHIIWRTVTVGYKPEDGVLAAESKKVRNPFAR